MIIVNFCLCNVIYAEQIPEEKEQETEAISPIRNNENLNTINKISNGVNIKQASVQRERDPFSVSTKLLTETVSGRYVSFSEGALGYFDLPKIEITGIMVVGDEAMATAEIEALGAVTLKPNEKIIIKSNKSSEKAFKSFIIKEITPSELVVLLEDGLEVRGRFR